MGQNQTRTPLKRGVRGGAESRALQMFNSLHHDLVNRYGISMVIFSICRHKPLSLIFSKGNTTVATSRAGIAYPSEVYEFIPGFWWGA
jgi:hypothetical protein